MLQWAYFLPPTLCGKKLTKPDILPTMIRKPSDTQALGLDLEKSVLKTAHLEMLRGKVKINRLEAYTLESPKEASLYQEQCSKFLTVAAMNGSEALIRKLRIKLQKPKDVEAAFPFEAESQLPFPAIDAYLDKIVVGKQDDSTHLTLLAAKKSAVEKCLNRFEELKVVPEILTTTPHALAAFEGAYSGTKEEVLVLYLGEESALIARVVEGKLLASHSLPIGVETLEKAYHADVSRTPDLLDKPISEIDFLGSDIALAPALKEALEKYGREIKWMVLSEIKQSKTPYPLMVLGEGAAYKGLDTFLFQEMNLPFVEIKASEGMEMNLNLLRRFAIAIGCALTALPNYPHAINFRQGEAEYPFPWKRYKGTIGVFVGASVALAAMIFLFGQAYMGYKEDLIKESYTDVLSEMGKHYAEFENKLAPQEPLIAIKDLTADDLKTRLSQLYKEVESEPDLFPLMPQVPTVTDTLAWLSRLKEMQGPEGTIQIDSFNYTLVKRPDITKRNERYQVKVDLELSAPTPKMARELHTALIQPNDFIDPKGEVKWSASKNKYRTSFFLRDKTTYLRGQSE